MLESQSVDILLVEDNHGHARLIERNLRRGGIGNRLIHLENGRKALDYVAELGNDEQGQCLPLLILLDLNMPEIDGFEVLAKLRKEERTRQIPVIILTSTSQPEEIERCYELGCNIYITKPVEYDSFSEAIQRLGLFLNVVRLPCERGERMTQI